MGEGERLLARSGGPTNSGSPRRGCYTDIMDERRSFVTIVRWPSSFVQEDKVEALVAALGMDPYDAQLACQRPVPQPLGILTVNQARDAAKLLRERGVPALAIGARDFDSLGMPLIAKRLVQPMGAPPGLYMAEPWRGEGRGFNIAEALLLVRGKISRIKTTQEIERDDSLSAGVVIAAGGGITGAAAAMAINEHLGTGVGPRQSRDVGSTEILDAWFPDGSCVRVDGRKFNFDVLGPKRGLSDGHNSAALGLRLAEEAPAAQIDLDFGEFRNPVGMRVISVFHTATTTTRDDLPVFEFYTRWKFLIARALHRGRSSQSKS